MAVPEAAPSPTADHLHTPPRLVLFDGVCALCDRAVTWLIDHDPEARLRFAPLQGETAAAIRGRHPELASEDALSSMVFVARAEDGTEAVYRESQAAFRIGAELPSPWRALRLFGLLPRFLTDLGYRLVARTRYRVWGKRDACRMPTPDEKDRFLA